MVHASQRRPAPRWNRTNQVIDTSQTNSATLPKVTATKSSTGVSARIIHSSENANAVVEAAVKAKNRLAQARRSRNQTRQ